MLDPAALVDAIEAAYRALAAGSGVSAPRLDLQAPPDAAGHTYQLGLAAGLSGRYGAVRLKSDMTYLREVAGAPRKEKYAVEPGLCCGLVLLFSAQTGAPLALMHDGVLQHMRVAADSAIGARLMARPDAATLGMLGSGGMARAHLRALCATSGLRRVVVYSPTPAHAQALADLARALGLEAETAPSGAAAIAEADVLCACTSAIGPVVSGADLCPGTHVMAIGGGLDALASARVDVWLRLGQATAAPEWGGQPIEEECLSFSASGQKAASGGARRFGDIPVARRVMLGALLADPGLGRTRPEQITFSDRGNVHGLQFAAAAGHVYEQACARGLGREMALADFTQTIRN